MEGVRRAIAGLGGYDASPKDIQSVLKSQFGINMDTSMISNYKSALKGAVRAVKDVVDKLGADKVRQLAEVLGA